MQGEGFGGLLRGAVVSMHQASAVAPIRFPGLEGGFPGDILLRPRIVRSPRSRSDTGTGTGSACHQEVVGPIRGSGSSGPNSR